MQKSQEKAKELIDKFFIFNHLGNQHAIICALIVAEEALMEHMFGDSEYADRRYSFWSKVKNELKSLQGHSQGQNVLDEQFTLFTHLSRTILWLKEF